MKGNEFIFSNRLFYRILRHVAFWVVWYLYYLVIYHTAPWFEYNNNLNPLSFIPLNCQNCYFNFFLSSIYYLLGHIIAVYIFYFSLRPFGTVNKKILVAVTGLIIALTAHILYTYFLYRYVMFATNISFWGLSDTPDATKGYIIPGRKFFTDTSTSVITLLGLVAVFKLGKQWYLKQMESDKLIKEKLKIEVQLLKAQVHPHFLFNTLNNIYSFILTSNPKAPELILKLSDLLKYILTECDQPKISLQKELKMVFDYIDLQKIRYGDRLKFELTITGNPNYKLIAPLLLLPFIENCFKHGASNMLQNAWVKLNIVIDENYLTMSLRNSQPPSKIINNHNGIGLSNVQQRLQLLYRDQHLLQVTSKDEIFSVYLTLRLENITTAITNKEIINYSMADLTFETYNS